MEPSPARWFETQIKPYEPMLRAWLRRRFSCGIDIDDVLQEAYLRLWRRAAAAGLDSPKAFLFAVARNLAVDQVRQRRTVKIVGLSPEVAFSGLEEAAGASETERELELQLLEEAIAALPLRCREIFRLRKVVGLSQSQIARRLGISEHTVSAQLTIGFHKCAAYVLERASWRRGCS